MVLLKQFYSYTYIYRPHRFHLLVKPALRLNEKKNRHRTE
jgi:hypothetical protein